MYEAFYGLQKKPFTILPDPGFLYWGRVHTLAYSMLEYGLFNQAGVTVITGEIGCGKTTLLRHLLEQHADETTIGLLSNTHEAASDLLGWVLYSFGLQYDGLSKVAKFEVFQQFLIDEYAAGRRVVLVIDEAQNLGLAVLEELRLFTNINQGSDVLLQLVLVGQPQLKTLLQKPSLVQFAQRVTSDFHIKPFSREEVGGYVAARLKHAGREDPLFLPEALDHVYEYSRGVPRLINSLCDMCLLYGSVESAEQITGELVESVLKDKSEFGVFDVDADKLAPDENVDLPQFEVNAPGKGPALVIHDHKLARQLLGRTVKK
ncbi:MAG: AAA family ATPase [Pseudomonadota bacterium]